MEESDAPSAEKWQAAHQASELEGMDQGKSAVLSDGDLSSWTSWNELFLMQMGRALAV